MRIALFSDIHGNMTGLTAVLRAIDADGGADRMVAAGDVIGGESGGDDLLELLAARDVLLVRGDSDTLDKLVLAEQHALAAPGTTRSSARYYRAAREWLSANISAAWLARLAALPLSLTVEAAPGHALYVCHATPRSPTERICAPQCDSATMRAAYGAIAADVVAFGHYHTPFVKLLDGRLYLNVASVGLRPDGLSRYTMLTFADDQWVVEQRAVPFDQAAEDRRARERGVPPLEN